jgi:hypothetical protein
VFTLSLVAGLWAAQRFTVAVDVMALVVLTAIVLDGSGEWRARSDGGDLVVVWSVHAPYAVDPIVRALADAGIPAWARGVHHRTLLQFFGPYVPVGIVVPAERAEEANRTLRALWPSLRPPEPVALFASSRRRASLGVASGIALVAAVCLAALVLAPRAKLRLGGARESVIYRVDYGPAIEAAIDREGRDPRRAAHCGGDRRRAGRALQHGRLGGIDPRLRGGLRRRAHRGDDPRVLRTRLRRGAAQSHEVGLATDERAARRDPHARSRSRRRSFAAPARGARHRRRRDGRRGSDRDGAASDHARAA